MASATRKLRKKAALSPKERQKVFERARNRCAGCGRCFPPSQLTVDHIVPISKGGSRQRKNLQAMCWPCNSAKADRLPVDLGGVQ